MLAALVAMAFSGINEYVFFAGFVVLQFVVLASAWNILGGYAGYVNFGVPAFVATGAYAALVMFKGLGAPLVVQIVFGAFVAGVLGLRRHAAVPIHGHRNGWGYLSRHPALGWSFRAWQTIWRLAGVDHLHVNGLRNKFSESDDSVIDSARSLLEPFSARHPMRVMPVFSSGQTGRQAHDTFAALGCADLIHAAGGGIMAHPDGPAGGVQAMREAWAAAMAGEALAARAQRSAALAAALPGW